MFRLLLLSVLLFSGVTVASGQPDVTDNVCTGETRVYHVIPNPGSIYTWWIDGVVQSGYKTSELIHTWTDADIHLIELQELSATGCAGPIRSGEVFVTRLPDAPRAIVTVQPSCPLREGSVLLSDLPDEGTWTIEPGILSGTGTSALLTGLNPGIYTFKVKDYEGCISEASETITIGKIDNCLVLSDVISPNGDLINDVWNIGNSASYPLMEVTIYNRWGQAVWKSGRGYPVPWDGRSNGRDLPVDSYHYIIDLHDGSRPVIGTVTVVR
jgi:gliding motility-associated-like protein